MDPCIVKKDPLIILISWYNKLCAIGLNGSYVLACPIHHVVGPRTDIIDGSVRIIIHFQLRFYRDRRGRNRSGDSEPKKRRRVSVTINKMSRRRSLRGKEIAVDEVEVVPASLPERLFTTDRFPCEKINMYSTIDFLLCVRDALNGTEEMAMLLRSCFGTLFRFPVRGVLMGKVIHGMLTRQVLTKKGGFILLRSAFVLVMIA
ncbi:hypothetical protein YC2023_011918 [Brassica napus]